MTSFITGIIVAIATFPGVILRQIITLLLCRHFRLPVFKVCYFQPIGPFGFVVYEPPRLASTALAMIFVPPIFNTVLGFAIGAPAAFALLTSDSTFALSVLDLFLAWLGLSFAVHSIPTVAQAESIRKILITPAHSSFVRVLGLGLMITMYTAAYGSILWLDVIYAAIIVIGVPVLGLEIIRSTA